MKIILFKGTNLNEADQWLSLEIEDGNLNNIVDMCKKNNCNLTIVEYVEDENGNI